MKKFKINYIAIITLVTLLLSQYQSYIIYFLISIIFHELGHFVAVRNYGRIIELIEILPIGCFFELNNNLDESNKEKIVIYSFGILANCILIFLGVILGNKILLMVNIGLVAYNILPIPPLDGYYLMLHILAEYVPYKISLKIICVVGSLTIIGLLIFIVVSRSGMMFIIYILYFMLMMIKEWKSINKKYELFLLRKHLYKNNKLKVLKNKDYHLPLINNLFFGKRNLFICDKIVIDENDLLKKRYSNVN